MTTKLTARQLRKNLEHATKRMLEIHKDYSENAEASTYSSGVAGGVDLALHALWLWTNGEYGANLAAPEDEASAATS